MNELICSSNKCLHFPSYWISANHIKWFLGFLFTSSSYSLICHDRITVLGVLPFHKEHSYKGLADKTVSVGGPVQMYVDKIRYGQSILTHDNS